MAKGAKAPFNHFVSSLRQTANLLDPANTVIRLKEADHLYKHGHFQAAARYAMSGNVKDKDERASLVLRAAEAYLEDDDIQAMERYANKALKLSDDPFTVLGVADFFRRMNQADKAEELAVSVLEDGELEPEVSSYAHILISEARLHSGKEQGAREAAQKAYEINETDQVRGFLASTLTKLDGSRDEGLALYRELFKASPSSPAMMNNYGYALISNATSDKQLDEGYRLLKKANRLTPFEPNLLDSLGWAYYLYGDYKKAETYITKAIELFEPFDHWELHYHLGDVYWRQGKETEARQEWETSLSKHPPKKETLLIEERLQNGIQDDAPEEREPPFVPKVEEAPETRSINL
jgi:tetratricopeptide (TPR) repeat protein